MRRCCETIHGEALVCMRSQVGVPRGEAQSNQDLQARVEELETEVEELRNGLQSSGEVNFQLQVRCTLSLPTLQEI